MRLIVKTRKATARRDWDAEAHEAWLNETFGRVEELAEPLTGTHYVEAQA